MCALEEEEREALQGERRQQGDGRTHTHTHSRASPHASRAAPHGNPGVSVEPPNTLNAPDFEVERAVHAILFRAKDGGQVLGHLGGCWGRWRPPSAPVAGACSPRGGAGLQSLLLERWWAPAAANGRARARDGRFCCRENAIEFASAGERGLALRVSPTSSARGVGAVRRGRDNSCVGHARARVQSADDASTCRLETVRGCPLSSSKARAPDHASATIRAI